MKYYPHCCTHNPLTHEKKRGRVGIPVQLFMPISSVSAAKRQKASEIGSGRISLKARKEGQTTCNRSTVFIIWQSFLVQLGFFLIARKFYNVPFSPSSSVTGQKKSEYWWSSNFVFPQKLLQSLFPPLLIFVGKRKGKNSECHKVHMLPQKRK